MTSSNDNVDDNAQGLGWREPGATVPNGGVLEIRSLDSHVLRAPRYVVRDWRGMGVLPEGATIFAGKQGSGKSTCLRKIISDFTSGSGLFRGEQVGNVLYTCWEDDPDSSILPEVAANGGDPSRIGFLTGVREGTVTRQWQYDDLQRIEEYCERNPEVRIIIVDTLTALSNTIGRNSNRARAAGAITSALHQFGLRLGIAVVIVCHLTKLSRRGGALDAVAGSTELTSGPRAVWLVGHHPEDPDLRSMVLLKHNLSGLMDGCTFRTEALPLPRALELIRQRGLRTEGDLPNSMFVRTEILTGEPVPTPNSVFLASVNRVGPNQPSALDRAVALFRQLLQSNQGCLATRNLEDQARTAGFSSATYLRARNFMRENGEIQTFQSGREHFVSTNDFDREGFIAARRAETTQPNPTNNGGPGNQAGGGNGVEPTPLPPSGQFERFLDL